jgi:hypothetical protein
MASINMLLLNNFDGLSEPSNFSLLHTLEGEEPVVTNTKYYMRFKHDLKNVTDAEAPEFQAKMQRRIVRFKKNMCEIDNILFIRRQEIQKGRIYYNGGLLRPERMELDEFIDILKIKYNCAKVTIIYINLDEDGWNDRGDILAVKTDSLDCEWEDAHNSIRNLFIEKDVMKQLDKN